MTVKKHHVVKYPHMRQLRLAPHHALHVTSYSVLMVFFMQERYRVNYGVWLVTPISIDTDWSPIVRGTSGITLLI